MRFIFCLCYLYSVKLIYLHKSTFSRIKQFLTQCSHLLFIGVFVVVFVEFVLLSLIHLYFFLNVINYKNKCL